MPIVVVIDGNAQSRALVHDAAPADWTLLDAADGLSGLDLVRQHYRELGLVILDMNLPDVDGRIVCVRIRELRADLSILPFTAQTNTVEVYEQLACLPPVFKPTPPDSLAQALRIAITQPAPPYFPNPIIDFIKTQSSVIEQLARRQRTMLPVGVYAASAVKRAGLLHLLAETAQTYEAVDLRALDVLLRCMQMTAVVAPAEDYPRLAALVQEYRVPLVLIAADPVQAALVNAVEIVGVLLEQDAAIAVRLAAMLQAIAAGVRPVIYPLDTQTESMPRHVVPPTVLQRFADANLTPRALDILWLDYQGLTTEQIARTLKIVPATVDSHWKRIQRVLKHSRKDVQVWVRELLQDYVSPDVSNGSYWTESHTTRHRITITNDDANAQPAAN